MSVKFTWRGELHKAAAAEAQRRGLTAAAADAVTVAQTVVPVDTGNLKNSITFTPVKGGGKGYSTQFGSFTINYALWVEIGTRKMSAQPYIRPAADRIGPKLGDYIRAEMHVA